MILPAGVPDHDGWSDMSMVGSQPDEAPDLETMSDGWEEAFSDPDIDEHMEEAPPQLARVDGPRRVGRPFGTFGTRSVRDALREDCVFRQHQLSEQIH